MKRIIAAIIISAGLISCAAAGYWFGCRTAEALAAEQAAKIESEYQIQIENYENKIKDYKGQIKKLKNQKQDASSSKEEKEDQEETLGNVPLNKDYEYLDFETVFGPFCTEDDVNTIKNEAARVVSESEYKNMKQITCSKYYDVDSDSGRVTTYARLDDKGVLKLTYSIRYGTPSAEISEYSQKELSELEAYGRVMDIDSTETVTPYPENEEEK